MKHLIISFLILSFQSPLLAYELNQAEISMPELNFENNKGSGILQKLNINIGAGLSSSTESQADSSAVFKLQRDSKNFQLGMGPVKFNLQNIDQALLQLNVLKMSNLEIKTLLQKSHSLNLADIYLNHGFIGELTAEDLTLNCIRSKTPIISLDLVIQDCLNRLSLRAEKLDVPELTAFWSETFSDLPANSFSELFVTAKDLELEVNQGYFDLNLKIKGLPLARVRADGKMTADLNQKKAQVRIDKVKFGLLNVTDLVMSQLKKRLPPQYFKVEAPYVYITW